MKTIDFVTNPFPGGGPRNIYTLSKILKELGYESSVIFFNELSSHREIPNIKEKFKIDVKEPNTLYNAINRTMGISNSLKLRVFPFFLLQQYITRPMSIISHELPDAFISTFWASVTPTDRIARKKKKEHFYFVQADERGFSRNKNYKRMAEKSYRMNLPRFTHSRWVKEHLDLTYGGENEYIGMGVNHESFKPKNLEMEATVFTIARSLYDKGFDIFVKAVNELYTRRKDFTVRIAGEREIVDNMANNGIIKFPFEHVGWLSNDTDLASHYERSIFVNSGRFEAFPMPPIEAMASGSSVVMTDMPGNREYAKDNMNCLLCRSEDYIGFANRIDELLTSESLRRKLSLEAIRTAKEYTWKHVSIRMKRFLESHDLYAD